MIVATQPRVRHIEACVLAAVPRPREPPISRMKLAMRAGYSYTRHFLGAIRKLLAEGKLTEHDGRVRLAAVADDAERDGNADRSELPTRALRFTLSHAESAIVALLAGYSTPRKGAWIAYKIRLDYCSGIRSRLSTLCRFGVLLHVDGGYLLNHSLFERNCRYEIDCQCVPCAPGRTENPVARADDT